MTKTPADALAAIPTAELANALIGRFVMRKAPVSEKTKKMILKELKTRFDRPGWVDNMPFYPF